MRPIARLPSPSATAERRAQVGVPGSDRVGAGVVLGALAVGDRPALAALLSATGVFRESEVAVALELFDEAFAHRDGGSDPEGYAFVGAFLGDVGAPDGGAGGAVQGAVVGAGVGANDRTLVGYACWGRTPDTRGTFDLYWLAVDPGRQRSGIGAALVGEVERRAAAIGGRLLVIEASGRADNAGVRRFYERLGSTTAATVRDFYAPGDDRIIYTRRVGGAVSIGGSDRS